MQQPITVGNGNYWLWLKQSRARVCRPSGLQSFRHRNRYHATLRNVLQRCILETPVWIFIPVVTRNSFTGADKVYIACGCTDLRKGIDGLARLVQQQFALDPFANTPVPVLRAAARPYQGLVLGKGRLHPAVQATGTGRVPVATLGIRGRSCPKRSCLAVLQSMRSRWSWSS